VTKKHAAAHLNPQQKVTAKQIVNVLVGPHVAAATGVNVVNIEVVPVKEGQAAMLWGLGPFYARGSI